ncbi:DUF1080 domain-containing protein [Micromonospora sp. CPCC 205371]|nr:DUF1080 domain-containing protein [Micromonospora sp. CPCC 205371]
MKTQRTSFSLDVFGRYVCNTYQEATASGPFDLIVVGGGTFGAALAHYLFGNDRARVRRILVLEGGPFLLSEHVQNLPLPGLGAPGPGEATSIADLRAAGADRTPRREVWGLPWHSSTRFIGLAYCVGGRSLYWGGWSPEPLDDELPTDAGAWPKPVVDDLRRYYPHTARQIGVDETNDFIYGDLHNALRKTLFDGISNGTVQHAVPFGDLPDHPVLRARPGATVDDLRALLGDPNLPAGTPAQDLRNLLKVEAPLAVQVRTLPGLFPFNKFSPVPLLMRAARDAWTEAPNDDARKRLMVVPNCHVNRLRVQDGRVVAVETNHGDVPVPAAGKVIVALGTVESARLALNSFTGIPGGGPIGGNLMAHLRSNLTIRVPRANVPNLAATPGALQAAALFVKGRYHGPDGAGPLRHFHLQITAAGLGQLGADAEAELFQKIPDIDTIDRFTTASDSHVVVTIRGIGEMQPRNPNSFVRQDPETDDVFGDRRAFVQLQESAADTDLWTAMDTAADDVALLFAGGQPYQVRLGDGSFATVPAGQRASQVAGIVRHDGLGTTHHEAGTLWMGDSPANSVTNTDARFHNITNAYAVGPALQPTIGSPNPMLTGVALAHRLADHLVPVAPTVGQGPKTLFNGVDLDGWQMAGPGSFTVVDGTLVANPGGDLGLLWSTTPAPPNFVLRCEWRRTNADDNSGVFVRFPNPNSKGYNNPAYVPVHFGFEVQIDENAPAPAEHTGAIYGEPNQQFNLQPALPPGDDQWNSYEIRVQDQTYTVHLNGVQVTQFANPHAGRGKPTMPDAPSFIGLQAHTGPVAFRKITIEAI